MLAVQDAAFSAADVNIVCARVSSPTANRRDALKDYMIAVEAINPGARAECTLRLDTYLGTSEARRLHFDGAGISWDSLAERTRRLATRLARSDANHLGQLGFDAAARALGGIIERLQQEPPESLVLRVGWGIGWSGTTGALLSCDERNELIRLFGGRLSRHGAHAYSEERPFPKSRRLVTHDGNLNDVFGWVLLRPAGAEQLPEPIPPPLLREPRGSAVAANAAGATEPTGSARQQADSPGERIASQIAAMRTQDVAGQIQGFYDRASKQCPEVGDRRRALAAICDAINRANLMKKWRGKPWVATLLKELE